jgi:S-DNA-T family DNA segregation ATPase FtsK/SpoIIIE
MAKENKLIESEEDARKEKVNEVPSGKNRRSFLSKFSLDQVSSNKLRNIFGALFILFSIYFFLSCLSYFFTWKADQDRVMNQSLWNILFDGNEDPLENWLGKFGAWISHLFIYCWFGIASFLFSFISLVLGTRLLLHIKIVSLRKLFTTSLLLLTWISIFLSYFSPKISILGGTFGFEMNQWLSLVVGKFGAFLFILMYGLMAVVLIFNPNFHTFPLKKAKDTPENDLLKDIQTADDLKVSNTFKESDIKDDNISHTIDLNDTPNAEDNVHEENDATTVEFDKPITLVSEGEANDESDEEADFQVEVAQEEDELSENEINEKIAEFGEYDPTLDLSSYTLPSIDLLVDYAKGKTGINVDKTELENNKNKIVETLANYKIDIDKIKATVGPTVTLYEIVPAPGIRISKIKNLEDDIALSLSALGIRIIAPIPGKGTIGIEVPNSKPEVVPMRSLISSEKFQNADMELPIVMGKTITNETMVFDLTKMPHLLVAGATGQGKSVGLNAIIVSILYKKHPSQVKFVLVDPKKVELTLYNKIERHFLAKLPDTEDAIITDTSKVVNTLNSLCIEMDDRYEILKNAQVRNIKEYNAKFIGRKLNPENGHRFLPYIVVLIDEFADLIMTAGKEVEHPIARLAQLARAIGIHLIVATQRPSVNVITGMIKANFPARIAFRVLSKIDSRTILDASGADQLIGRGDMLISNGNDLTRLQCGLVDTDEIEEICDFIGNQRGYANAFLLPEYVGEEGEGNPDVDLNEMDTLFADGARIVVTHQQGSASLLQRKLKLGYNRAGRIIDQLEAHGIIGPFKGSKAREVLFSDLVQLEQYLNEKGLQ